MVAEDLLQQKWYAGEVDYWFRRYGDMRRYLYVAADGDARDIYMNGRVWFATSGETVLLRDY